MLIVKKFSHFLQVGKLREKIAEHTTEHARLVEENEKLKKDNKIMVTMLNIIPISCGRTELVTSFTERTATECRPIKKSVSAVNAINDHRDYK